MKEVREIRITDIEGLDSVDVVEVLVKTGERVEANQPLITLESEKAMMDFPAPDAGTVKEIHASAGGKVQENDVLLTLEVAAEESQPGQQRESESAADAGEASPETPAAAEESPARPAVSTRSDSAYASPGVYQYARELGVELAEVQGSGRQQRVTKEDVQHYVRASLQQGGLKKGAQKAVSASSADETEAVALTKIQKLTAANMLAAWQSIPHVTHFDRADVTSLERQRGQLAEKLKAKDIKLTPLAFVIKALAATLEHFPRFNASFDPVAEQLVLKKRLHIGIAVDTPHGLLVPVLRNVGKKTVTQVAAELVKVSGLARSRKLTPKHMAGAGMTISSLGNLGGQAFTPIINPPEVAILGVSKMIVREKTVADGVTQQKLLPLSLSYDHRVINGADAARFCTHLKGILEDVWKLAL